MAGIAVSARPSMIHAGCTETIEGFVTAIALLACRDVIDRFADTCSCSVMAA